MIKLINNWIFTLVEAVLLVAFTVLLLVFEGIFNILLGVALIIYSLIFVLTKVVSYRGVIQLIAIIEFFAVTILAIFVIVNQEIFPKGNVVNTTVGLAMWLRATTEILHSYHGQGEGRAAKRQFNAWKIFAYILLLTIGTFIATNAVANDSLIRYLIAGISTAASIIMIVLTYTNFRDSRDVYESVVDVTPVDDGKLLDTAKNDTKFLDKKSNTPVQIVVEPTPKPKKKTEKKKTE